MESQFKKGPFIPKLDLRACEQIKGELIKSISSVRSVIQDSRSKQKTTEFTDVTAQIHYPKGI